jgi:ferritin-like metal-binding protein YciE
MGENIHELFLEELQDIYHAEKQLTKALPKMAKKASSETLAEGFQNHLEETYGQIARIEECFEELGEKAKAKTCEAMKGLIKEASEMMSEDLEPEVMDVALISAAQKVEHYEIATYGTLIALAEAMGHERVVELLRETLEEEKACDEQLTEVGTSEVNPAAMESYSAEDEEEEQTGRGRTSGQSKAYAEMQKKAAKGTKSARQSAGRPANTNRGRRAA